jgi:hypothetical protein
LNSGAIQIGDTMNSTIMTGLSATVVHSHQRRGLRRRTR